MLILFQHVLCIAPRDASVGAESPKAGCVAAQSWVRPLASPTGFAGSDGRADAQPRCPGCTLNGQSEALVRGPWGGRSLASWGRSGSAGMGLRALSPLGPASADNPIDLMRAAAIGLPWSARH